MGAELAVPENVGTDTDTEVAGMGSMGPAREDVLGADTDAGEAVGME